MKSRSLWRLPVCALDAGFKPDQGGSVFHSGDARFAATLFRVERDPKGKFAKISIRTRFAHELLSMEFDSDEELLDSLRRDICASRGFSTSRSRA